MLKKYHLIFVFLLFIVLVLVVTVLRNEKYQIKNTPPPPSAQPKVARPPYPTSKAKITPPPAATSKAKITPPPAPTSKAKITPPPAPTSKAKITPPQPPQPSSSTKQPPPPSPITSRAPLPPGKVDPSIPRPLSCHNCFFTDYPLLIKNEKACVKKGDKLRLLFMILSTFWKPERRKTIRETWASVAKTSDKIKVVFVLGSSSPPPSKIKLDALRAENTLHGDLVMADVVDSYQNITIKSVIMLKWAMNFCANADFVIKGDDDIVYHTDNLLRRLDPVDASLPFVGGKVVPHDRVIRSRRSKYYISKQQYESDYYPDFTPGAGYVMSMPAVKLIAEAAKDVPFFPLQDVYITALVFVQHLGFKLTNLEGAIDAKFLIKNTCGFYKNMLFFPLEGSPMMRGWTDMLAKVDLACRR